MPERDRKNVSHHILPTAANLLGICFLMVTFIKASGLKNKTIIDDFAGVAIIIFLFASIFSYAAMRSTAKSEVYERVADLIFILGLGSHGVHNVDSRLRGDILAHKDRCRRCSIR